MKTSTILALLGGAAAGMVLGMMLAPDNGEENRKEFRRKVDEFLEKYCGDNNVAESPVGEAEAPANE